MHAPTHTHLDSGLERLLAWGTRPASFGVLSLILLLPLLAFALPVDVWTGNEENYFQLAFRRVAPDAFSSWHAVFDTSTGRIVSETIYGLLVKWLGYEPAHSFARIATAVLYAGSLGALFSAVRLSIVESAVVLVAFRALGEQILGGEWLFQGAEPKTLAYSLVFVAMSFAVRQRWYATAIACAGATAMHFLVGGFWSLAIGLCLAWHVRGNWRRGIDAAGLYLLLIAPVVVLLAHDQIGAAAAALPGPPIVGESLPPVDQIYAWRSAHHLSPFINPALQQQWMQGIGWLAAAIGAYLVALGLRPAVGLVVPLVGVGLLELVLAVGISYVDQDRLMWAKFYLFRPSSVTLLLLLVMLVAALRQLVPTRWVTIVTLVMVAASLRGMQMEYRRDRWERNQVATVPHQAELIAAVQAVSRPEDVVVFDPAIDNTLPGIRLNRALGRPTVVAQKFVPTAPQDLQRWYMLLRWRQRLFESGCDGRDTNVPVRLLVTFSADARRRVAGCGPELWRHGETSVTRVAP